METLSVNAQKHQRLDNQQPSPLQVGEGSTTIPKGSRVQVNSKRETNFYLTLCNSHAEPCQHITIGRFLCGQGIICDVVDVERAIDRIWQKDCVPGATIHGMLLTTKSVLLRQNESGTLRTLHLECKRFDVNRKTLAAIEKRHWSGMVMSVLPAAKIASANLPYIIKMEAAGDAHHRITTYPTCRHSVGDAMLNCIILWSGQEIMPVVLPVVRQIKSTMPRDTVHDAIGYFDDIVWPAWRHAESSRKRTVRNTKRDEIDKGLAGMKGSGELDSGVTSRVVSTILTWRQETKYPVVLIATANDVAAIPSMVYRKGRLDEVWATDLPTLEEREEIFKIHLIKRGRDYENFDIQALAKRTDDYVGAEIEAVIEDAMYLAFDEDQEVTTSHILSSIGETVPQSTRDIEELKAIREWVSTRARPVSAPKKTTRRKAKVRAIGKAKKSK